MIQLSYYSDIHSHESDPFNQCYSQKSRSPNIDQRDSKQNLIHSPFGKYQAEINIPNQVDTNSKFDSNKKRKVRLKITSLSPMEAAFRDVPSPGREFALGHTRHIENKSRNYFLELKDEYQHLLGRLMELLPGSKIELAHHAIQVAEILTKSDESTAIILSVEGAHALSYIDPSIHTGCTIDSVNDQKSKVYQHYLQVFTDNIRQIKSWGNGHHAPFFITLASHFWNMVCGHARSFDPESTFSKYDQQYGLNQGITALGLAVIEQLLSRENGRRILIDIRRMSANSRKEFYNLWEIYRDKCDPFPIICSHTAVNGMSRLAQSLRYTDNGLPSDQYFNTWSINLYDEDICYIYQSGGLIGLTLDEYLMPGAVSRRLIQKHRLRHNPSLVQAEYVRLLMANIFHIVRTINHPKAWDMIVMGTDAGGHNNHFEVFENFSPLPELADRMLEFLQHPVENPHLANPLTREDMQRLMFWFTPEELINKIMYQNTQSFLDRYYHENYLCSQKINVPA